MRTISVPRARRGRLALLSLVAFVAACTASAPPYIDLPAPYKSRGIQVELKGVVRTGTRMLGVHGTATNASGKDLSYVSIAFTGLDSVGRRVGDATARRDTLFRAGERWTFKALFLTKSAGTGLDLVIPARITTVVAE